MNRSLVVQSRTLCGVRKTTTSDAAAGAHAVVLASDHRSADGVLQRENPEKIPPPSALDQGVARALPDLPTRMPDVHRWMEAVGARPEGIRVGYVNDVRSGMARTYSARMARRLLDRPRRFREPMSTWETPKVVEIPAAMEIGAYAPAELDGPPHVKAAPDGSAPSRAIATSRPNDTLLAAAI